MTNRSKIQIQVKEEAMTTRILRRIDRRAHADRTYPYDPAHPVVPYAQTQRDAGAAIFLGAVLVAALMILIVLGLS